MSFSRLKILLPTLAAAFVAPGSAGDRAGNVEVRIAPALAARIAQETLGQPTESVDSFVEIKVPSVDAFAKNIQIRKTSEALRVYGQYAFGVNFESPFSLAVRIHDLKVGGQVRMKSMRFLPSPAAHSDSVDVALVLELRRVSVDSPRIWVKEQGLTSPSTVPRSERCPEKKRAIREEFAGESIWAEVTGASVVPKSNDAAEVPIVVEARFRVRPSTAVEVEASKERLVIEPLTIGHDVAKVLAPHYVLHTKRIEVPTVWQKTGGECFQGDSSGVAAFFEAMRPKIKDKIVEGMSRSLSRIAMRAATRALGKLNIPVGHAYSYQRGLQELPKYAPIKTDNTYVAPSRLLTLAKTAGGKTADGSTKTEGHSELLSGILWEVDARLRLAGFAVGSGGVLGISLADELHVNSHSQSQLARRGFGTLSAQGPETLRVLFDRSFFEAKADLIEGLKLQYARLSPAEIRLGNKGIEVHPRKDGRLSLVAHVEVDLTKSLVKYLARAGGNSEDIFRIPIQLNLQPKVVRAAGEPVLRLDLSVHKDLFTNDFGQRSNLDRTFTLLVDYLEKKVGELNTRLRENPTLIPLRALETQSPLRLDQVRFTETGALAVDLKLENVRSYLGKKNDPRKNADLQKQSAEKKTAEKAGEGGEAP
jgi:hypothetical protein